MTNELDYIDLGLSCADVCNTLERGIGGRQLDQLSRSVLGAIGQLTTWVKPAMCMLGVPPTDVSMSELWLRSKGRSPCRVNETQSLDSSTQRTIKIRSPLGDKTSSGSSTSSMYVALAVFDHC